MAEKPSMINDMTEGNVTKLMLKFAYPFVIANALQLVYNMVDMVIVGNFVGKTALSGVSGGGELLNFITFLGMGVTGAGQIMIAQAVGRKDHDAMSRIVGTMTSFLAICGVVIMILMQFVSDALLRWMNVPAEAFGQAHAYCSVCFWGVLFIYGYNIVSAVLRGMGDSRKPLMFIAIAASLNLLLDLLFVGVLKMESAGAALATILGQALSFIISVIYLYRRKESFGFDFKLRSFRIRKNTLLPMIKLGGPMALQHAAIGISMMFVSRFINAYGVAISAVTGVGSKLRQLISIFTRSMRQAGSSMIGQNIGAGKPERVRTVVRISLTITFSAAVILGAVFLTFPRQIFGLFNSDPEVLGFADDYMLYACLPSMLGLSLVAPFNAVVAGVGHSMLSLILGLVDGVVARIGLAMLLGKALGMGIHGLWLGDGLADFVILIIVAAYYFSGRWKTRKLLIA